MTAGRAEVFWVRWGGRWFAVLLVVAAADLAVRFGTGFDLIWIIRVEGPLFLAASIVLLRLCRQRPVPARWQRGLQTVLVTALALAGLRAVVWAVGLPVQGANLLVLAVATIGGAVLLWRRHRVRAAA